MGALYVKDDEARRMADDLARRRGITKTAAVKLALANELKKTDRRSTRDIADDLRRTSPLKHDLGVVIDKAFWDSLNDEEGD